MNEPSWSLRIALPNDIDAVSAVLAESYPALMTGAYDPDVLAAILPAMTRANPALLASGTYYVAETSKGELVACGGWTFEEPGSGKREAGVGHIRHFGTITSWTGKGLGRAIFVRCRVDALAAGVRTIRCYASLNALTFYQAVGFEVVQRLEIKLSNGKLCPTVIMTQAIGRP